MYFGRWTGNGRKVTWKRKVDRLVIPCLKNRHLVWSLVCLWTSGSVLELWNLDSGPFRLRVPWVGLAGPSLTPQRSAAAAVQLDYVPHCQLSMNRCFLVPKSVFLAVFANFQRPNHGWHGPSARAGRETLIRIKTLIGVIKSSDTNPNIPKVLFVRGPKSQQPLLESESIPFTSVIAVILLLYSYPCACVCNNEHHRVHKRVPLRFETTGSQLLTWILYEVAT